MKHEYRAEHAVKVTRAKGKMYEYQIPLDAHIALPQDLIVEQIFPLLIASLGDYSAEKVAAFLGKDCGTATPQAEVRFAALALSAYVEARFDESISDELLLISAVAFYLSDMPGNSIVQRRHAAEIVFEDEAAEQKCALHWVLGTPWKEFPPTQLTGHVGDLCWAVYCFYSSGVESDWPALIAALHEHVYGSENAAELLWSDMLSAAVLARLEHSARKLLPLLSGVSQEAWGAYFTSPAAVNELWPSQRLFGQAGIFAGASCVVQMPTSAGKTRAIEIILRAAFLSRRTTLALIVAPFRALCEEIAQFLDAAFAGEVVVNHLADALQNDFLAAFSEILGIDHEPVPHIVVLTPEKLLYVLRQRPDLVSRTGVVIYDEGHQFDNGSRGVAYELLITSIRKLLPLSAQTVLVSAVVRNAAALARWLLNDETAVLSDGHLQTQRTIAFSSWEKTAGQLRFFDRPNDAESFFVPRVLVQQKLDRFSNREKQRYFPERSDGSSIALYIAMRVVGNGGVAMFCGKKDSVPPLLKYALEVFSRGVSFSPPSSFCDENELKKLVAMYSKTFGDDCYLTKAARLGFFAHHSDTPHGFRLALEYAMREELIRLIVCTSTLAQGVNLPIRYLLVTNTRQGADQITVRDFQNLMGRAGRAGIHGEGTVIFADSRLYDHRNERKESWRWHDANELLAPENTEPTGSELLTLVMPLANNNPRAPEVIPLDPRVLIDHILTNEGALRDWVDNLPHEYLERRFTSASLHRQIDRKRAALVALQSYLMANPPAEDPESARGWEAALARETFAFSLGTEKQRSDLEHVFAHVARYLESRVPDTADRERFGRTLLGADDVLVVEAWIDENVEKIATATDELETIRSVWPLLMRLCRRKQLLTLEPVDVLHRVVERWMDGATYAELFDEFTLRAATYAWGTKRRSFDIDDVVGICEQVFWFDFPLIIAAMREALYLKLDGYQNKASIVRRFDFMHRRFKYGLPSQNCTYYFDLGLAERQLCVAIDRIAWGRADSVEAAREVLKDYRNELDPVIQDAPAYFRWVFANATG